MQIDMPTTNVNEVGGNCMFYIVDGKGLKLWYSWMLAKEQFVNQKMAAKYHAAPNVIGQMVSIKGKKLYGFYTELATLHVPYSDKELRNLKARFKRAFGINYPDLHDDNIGKVGDRLVFIDFDKLYEWEG